VNFGFIDPPLELSIRARPFYSCRSASCNPRLRERWWCGNPNPQWRSWAGSRPPS